MFYIGQRFRSFKLFVDPTQVERFYVLFEYYQPLIHAIAFIVACSTKTKITTCTILTYSYQAYH
jgi:hypothetical protein